MSMMADVHIVRVFTDAHGLFGNNLGVVLDAAHLDAAAGRKLASDLRFSEVVFVDDVEQARLRIFTPAAELPLAGHPLVGTSWLLSRLTGREVKALRPQKAAEVPTWSEGGRVWIRGRISDAPDWGLVEVADEAAVETLAVPPAPEYRRHQFWAWTDEPGGVMRARVFAADSGIEEDEATGSAAMRQVGALGRALVIRQGWGSEILARPAAVDGWAEIGGRVAGDGMRTVTVGGTA
ncbi:Phenazine biosynthesis PhzC/PhzF protein [Catenulispora acidiphila DSM 44928]|uniref:Phenazine biosynthesis PhzC/PhzF protein n=1 Tax=Catenulispora acidiphila (strain DSM 44928 / JCM 14897 / NBRC 102108 / NRRL B-24433 / ID139908) TaxID=479433 RepID=C7Q5D0_CATAD|nr:PhzF family phenazine biosynthesis protein [Catenulispora acidiphila]ACU75899.1 Phenazine biosynthesis PhzC/PhzF protein [Catenulispora acidiphila DSM 44928]